MKKFFWGSVFFSLSLCFVGNVLAAGLTKPQIHIGIDGNVWVPDSMTCGNSEFPLLLAEDSTGWCQDDGCGTENEFQKHVGGWNSISMCKIAKREDGSRVFNSGRPNGRNRLDAENRVLRREGIIGRLWTRTGFRTEGARPLCQGRVTEANVGEGVKIHLNDDEAGTTAFEIDVPEDVFSQFCNDGDGNDE